VQTIEHNDPVIRVVGINGSLRDSGYTRLAIRLALQGAEEVGAQTQLIDLREYDLVSALVGDRARKPRWRLIDHIRST
jgi:NAD(P)H-dependent FMN reductase